mmetsp:Transcript_7996/g.19753  ORF Transcript_7996/g.19753 Transcript_7996/m.19753 type:complete len:318 (+) Transcript_7996:767-1720(+)
MVFLLTFPHAILPPRLLPLFPLLVPLPVSPPPPVVVALAVVVAVSLSLAVVAPAVVVLIPIAARAAPVSIPVPVAVAIVPSAPVAPVVVLPVPVAPVDISAAIALPLPAAIALPIPATLLPRLLLLRHALVQLLLLGREDELHPLLLLLLEAELLFLLLDELRRHAGFVRGSRDEQRPQLFHEAGRVLLEEALQVELHELWVDLAVGELAFNVANHDLVLEPKILGHLLRDPRHHHIHLHFRHVDFGVEGRGELRGLQELLHLVAEAVVLVSRGTAKEVSRHDERLKRDERWLCSWEVSRDPMGREGSGSAALVVAE